MKKKKKKKKKNYINYNIINDTVVYCLEDFYFHFLGVFIELVVTALTGISKYLTDLAKNGFKYVCYSSGSQCLSFGF